MSLPTDAAERKRLQLYTFMFGYFPDAWMEVVRVARLGNDQHNPGQPLHWAREKSKDQMNAMFNHVFDYGMGNKKDTDGAYHLAKAIWRLSAQLQLDIEAERKASELQELDEWLLFYVDKDGTKQYWKEPDMGVTDNRDAAHRYRHSRALLEVSRLSSILNLEHA